jgi:hypothetical protein
MTILESNELSGFQFDFSMSGSVVSQIIWRKSSHIIWRMLWGVRELAELSTEARELALERFRLLVPHLEGKRTLRSVALEAEVHDGAVNMCLKSFCTQRGHLRSKHTCPGEMPEDMFVDQ